MAPLAAKWSALAAATDGVSIGVTAPFGCPTKPWKLAGATSARGPAYGAYPPKPPTRPWCGMMDPDDTARQAEMTT